MYARALGAASITSGSLLFDSVASKYTFYHFTTRSSSANLRLDGLFSGMASASVMVQPIYHSSAALNHCHDSGFPPHSRVHDLCFIPQSLHFSLVPRSSPFRSTVCTPFPIPHPPCLTCILTASPSRLASFFWLGPYRSLTTRFKHQEYECRHTQVSQP